MGFRLRSASYGGQVEGGGVSRRGAEGAEAGGLGEASRSDALQGMGSEGEIANASPAPAKRLKWVLGDSDQKCPSCLALAGQVHTQEDWDAAELRRLHRGQ